MQLDEKQKKTLGLWVAEGLGISDIQKKLKDEFQLGMSYMDVRFLLLDLGLKVKDRDAGPSAPAAVAALDGHRPAGKPESGRGRSDAGMSGSVPDEGEDAESDVGLGGGVVVEIDRIKKPGAIASGTVRFSDGVSAAWMLDQFGRVALHPQRSSYRPTQDDLMEFQQLLAEKLQAQGY